MSDRLDNAPLTMEELIARVLLFLAADPSRVARFFNVTGLTAETIRDAANTPGFADSVLHYVLGDESLMRQFTSEAEMKPKELLRLRAGLDGRAENVQKAESRAPSSLGATGLARRYR